MWISAAVFGGLVLLNDHAALRYALSAGAFSPRAAAASCAGAAYALAAAAALALGLKAAGRAALARLLPAEDSPPWLGPVELAAGLALSGPVLLGTGLLGLYTPPVLRALAAALAVAGAFEGGRLLRAPRPAWPRWSLPQAVAAGLLAYCAFDALCRALAPPLDIDALKYHLALPELYLRGGRVADIPWYLFSHWPQAVGLLYGLPLALGSDGAAALLQGAFALAAISAVRRAGSDELGEAAGSWAAAMLAAQPLLVHQAGSAMADVALTLLFLSSGLALWRWRSGGDARWAWAGGLLAGGAAAAKLHGLVLLALLAAWVLWREARTRGPRGRAAAGFAAAAALCAAPWYLKTWSATGNPTWPFLSGLFGGSYGAAGVASWAPAGVSGSAFSGGKLRFILLGDGALYLLLPAAAAVASGLGRRAAWPPLLTFLLAPLPGYLLFIANSGSAWRYLMPLFPALALAFGWGAAAGGLPALRWTALLFALSPAAALTQSNALFPLLGLRSRRWPRTPPRQAFLRASLPFEPMREVLRARLGPADRVLLFGDNEVYGLDVDYMYGEPYNQGLLPYASMSGPDELAAAFAARGVTHVCVNRSGDWVDENLRRAAPKITGLLDETLARRAVRLEEAGGRVLYRLGKE